MRRTIIGWVLSGWVLACGFGASDARAQVTEVSVRFHCSGRICFFDAARCARYVQDTRDLGDHAAPCRESRRTTCFDYGDVYDGEEYSRCFASAAMCRRDLRRFRERNYWSSAHDSPRYSGISECQTLRYSRQHAEQLARAERELAEARAEVGARRAQYGALAARRDRELFDVVFGGAVFSRAIYCAANGECRFTPAAEHTAVDEAHCIVGVDLDGRLTFACYTDRALCIERRAALVELQRDEPIPLRVGGDCFVASSGESGSSYYIIDEQGHETVPAPTDAESTETATDLAQAI